MNYRLTGIALTTLAMLSSTPVLSQTGLALQNLPDGNYAFKKIRPQYIVFRKTGSTIIGQSFSYQSDDGYCFIGTGVAAVITDATIEQLDEGGRNSKPVYAIRQSVSLGEYHPIKLEQVPQSTLPGFERCLRVMEQFKR